MTQPPHNLNAWVSTSPLAYPSYSTVWKLVQNLYYFGYILQVVCKKFNFYSFWKWLLFTENFFSNFLPLIDWITCISFQKSTCILNCLLIFQIIKCLTKLPSIFSKCFNIPFLYTSCKISEINSQFLNPSTEFSQILSF